jgi:hypothetical protein
MNEDPTLRFLQTVFLVAGLAVTFFNAILWPIEGVVVSDILKNEHLRKWSDVWTHISDVAIYIRNPWVIFYMVVAASPIFSFILTYRKFETIGLAAAILLLAFAFSCDAASVIRDEIVNWKVPFYMSKINLGALLWLMFCLSQLLLVLGYSLHRIYIHRFERNKP